MATLLQNATKLNQDRESLIAKYNSVEGMSVSSDATFTDLIDAFDELPIAVPPTVENGALIFPAGSSAEVEGSELQL